MSTFSKHKHLQKSQKQLQHVLDNLLKLLTDCDIRRLVKAHNIKSVLDLIELCLFNNWGKDLDITVSISKPILEDQCMLLINLFYFKGFVMASLLLGILKPGRIPQSNNLVTLSLDTVYIHQNLFPLLSEP